MPSTVVTQARSQQPHGMWRSSGAATVSGFTLIEVIIALVISAILFAVALPNFRSVIQNYRITTYTNDLVGDLNFARSEAIKRNVNVGILCITRAAVITPCTGGAWENGRIIFVDQNNDNTWSSDEETLRIRSGIDETNITIHTPPPAPGMQTVYTFDRRGSLNAAAADVPFTICDDRGLSKAKRVIINYLTGQIRMDVSNLSTPGSSC